MGKAGVIALDKIVNEHGSVFRPVHDEDDFGIDGFIELVKAEVVSGRLVAVQIKTGPSYLGKSGDKFEVAVDQTHLDYWLNYMVPVILVCEVIIANAGQPMVRLVAIRSDHGPRHDGQWKGRVRMAEDFNTLPPDVAAAFGMDTP